MRPLATPLPPSCGVPYKKPLNVLHDFSYLAFLDQDALRKLFWWQICHIFLRAGVLAVQIAVVRKQIRDGNSPRAFVLLAGLPPCNAIAEFLELHRRSFCIALSTVLELGLVRPNLFIKARTVKETQIGTN